MYIYIHLINYIYIYIYLYMFIYVLIILSTIRFTRQTSNASGRACADHYPILFRLKLAT